MLQNLIVGIKNLCGISGSPERNGNFSQCTFRCNGHSGDVNSFIDAITVYKDIIVNILDIKLWKDYHFIGRMLLPGGME